MRRRAQLSGGNDGLNTVVPYFDRHYYIARPDLAFGAPGSSRQRAGAAIQLDRDAGLGLHPGLTGLKDLYDQGKATIIQGVGYPNPNRSHFASMDIWQTGRIDGTGSGWIGRCLEHTSGGDPNPYQAIAIGRTTPLALMGEGGKPLGLAYKGGVPFAKQDLQRTKADVYEKAIQSKSSDQAAQDHQHSFLDAGGRNHQENLLDQNFNSSS